MNHAHTAYVTHTHTHTNTIISTRLRREQFVTIQPCFENDLLGYSNMILWMPRGIIVNIQHFFEYPQRVLIRSLCNFQSDNLRAASKRNMT